jgi:surface antigen
MAKTLFIRGFLMAALLTVALVAPVYADGNEAFGTLLGAGLGGFAGNQFGHGNGRIAATVGGVVLGGVIGNSIGHAADQSETVHYAPAPVSYAQPVYYAPRYVPNYVAPPDPPPAPVYNERPSDYCREFSQLVRIGGEMQESYGTACLQSDGTWRAID